MSSPKKGIFEIVPDSSLADTVRKVDLDIPEAISELVANSFDAKKNEQISIKIEIGISELYGEKALFVADNGSGMDLEELQKALTLGKSEKEKHQKGVYGLGLKTAGGIIGDIIIIETSPSAKGDIFRAKYDIIAIKDKGIWEVPYDTVNRENSFFFQDRNESGTVIAISELNRGVIQFDPIIRFLSLAFKPHLEQNDEIFVNQRKIKTYEYGELHENTTRLIKFEKEGVEVEGWIALQKVGQKKIKIGTLEDSQYGMSLYRRGQLVEAFYKKFFNRIHPEFGNVIGELNIYPLEVNYTKKGINILNPKWRSIENEIKKIVREYGKASRTLHTKTITKGKKKIKLSDEEALVRMYRDIGLKPDGTKIDDIEEEETEEEKEGISISTPSNQLIILLEKNEIELAGHRIEFVFVEHIDDESPWQWHNSLKSKEGVLTIYLNKSFNLLKNAGTENERKIIYALALAEELQDELNKEGYPVDLCQKQVFEWLNENYEYISYVFI